MADMRPLHDWSDPPATLTRWRPTAATMVAAETATVSSVPPSYEQEQHLRAYHACEQRREEMARLLILVWDEPGLCDLRIMSDVVTAHVRRHDTYHSWFSLCDNVIERHILSNPDAIQMKVETLGELTSEAWQAHIARTPGPFDWDCFGFGILQRATGFTFFACIDHLHADSSVLALLMSEIHGQYRSLTHGETPRRLAPTGHYLDYCAAQRQRAATMVLTDPEVADWIAFLHRNEGRMPPFPMPLGELEDRSLAEHVHMDILDANDMVAFESVCLRAGARVIGGLLACSALSERELTGIERYSVVTPTSTRKSPRAFRTSGWCIGLVPIDIDVVDQTFDALAKSAQQTFDDRLHLASAPIERVLELASGLPTIRPVATGGVMLSYMDMNRFPLGAQIARDWHLTNGRIYINQGMAAQVALWFFRAQGGLTLMAAHPANPTARASMQRYVEALKDAFRQVITAE